MAFVQFASALTTSSTVGSATFSTAPTSGNTLVAFGCASSITGANTGWTLVKLSGLSTLDVCWWYKGAGASESTTQSPFKFTSAETWSVGIWEYSNIATPSTLEGNSDAESTAAAPPTQTLTASAANAGDTALIGGVVNEGSSGTATIASAAGTITIDGHNNATNGFVMGHLDGISASGSHSFTTTFGSGTASHTVDGGLLYLQPTSTTIHGTLSVTLGTATISAAATNLDHATASVTLGAATVSAAATHPVHAVASVTLGAAAIQGSGTNLDHGRAAVTLGAATLSATAAHPVHGAASVTLGAATPTAAATNRDHASVAVTLGSATLAATGTVVGGITATLDVALGSATVAGTGTVLDHATASVTLGNATIAATAFVGIITQESVTLVLPIVAGAELSLPVIAGSELTLPVVSSEVLSMPVVSEAALALPVVSQVTLEFSGEV